MRTVFILFILILMFPLCLLAQDWNSLNRTDGGMTVPWGNRQFLFRGGYAMSRPHPYGNQLLMVVVEMPDELPESMLIEFDYQNFNVGCTGNFTYPGARAHWEMAFPSFVTGRIDSINDVNSIPLWISPSFNIPDSPVSTHRTFWSSLNPRWLQQNGWDNLIPVMIQLFDNGDPILFRLIPEDSTGMIVNDFSHPGFWYTTDIEATNSSMFNEYNGPLDWLTPQEFQNYHGWYVSGVWRAPFGTDAFSLLYSLSPAGAVVGTSQFFINRPAQNILSGIFYLGITSTDMSIYPKLSIQHPGGTSCGLDSLYIARRP